MKFFVREEKNIQAGTVRMEKIHFCAGSSNFLKNRKKEKNSQLTISAHANSNALLQSAVLTPVAVDPLDHTLLILGTWSILDFLLDGTTKEAL